VLGIPLQRDLTTMRPILHGLKGLATDEIVVEVDDAGVVEVPRREIIILDVLRDEAAADRRIRLERVAREPLAIGLHVLAGIDCLQWRRDPAGFHCAGAIGAAADELQTELGTGFDDRIADLITLGPRTPEFEPRSAGEGMSERADLVTGDLD